MYLNVRRGLAIVASAALLAAAGACTSGAGTTPPAAVADPGITADSILLGTHQPLTGPASGGYSKISPATKAYFEYINKHGGVNGRKITYKVVDDTYNPQTTNTVVRSLVEQDKVFAILNGLGTPTHTGVIDYLKQQKVPDLFVASGALSWNQPTKYPGTFAVNPDYTSEGKVIGNYIKTTYPGKKVCHLGQGDDFGTDALNGLEKGLGAPVVAKETYTTSKTDLGAQITKLKASGCEVLATATIPAFTAIAIGTGAAIGWRPQVVASGVGGDYRTVGVYLKEKAAALLEGFVTTGYLPQSQDAADPWNVYFQQINKDFNNNAAYDGNTEYGMAVAWLAIEAFKKAGPNLTRASLLAAIEGGGFTGGPGLVPLGYSKTSHAGYTGVRLSKVTGATQAYFGTAYTTDSGDGAVTPYTGTASAPPAYLGAS